MESLCRQPEATKKIEEIANGILRQNLRLVQKLEKVENRDKEVIQRMNYAKGQIKTLENRLDFDKVNKRYRVTVSDTLSNNKAASLMDDAIVNELEAVQLVVRFNGNNQEMEKDWEMMSELDKDEFIRKKIIREL